MLVFQIFISHHIVRGDAPAVVRCDAPAVVVRCDAPAVVVRGGAPAVIVRGGAPDKNYWLGYNYI